MESVNGPVCRRADAVCPSFFSRFFHSEYPTQNRGVAPSALVAACDMNSQNPTNLFAMVDWPHVFFEKTAFVREYESG